MKFGEHVVQAAAAASEVGFEDEITERLEPEDVLHEKSERAGGVGFPLAGAPRVAAAEAIREAGGDCGAGEQSFAGAEGLAAGTGMDDAKAAIDRAGEWFCS